uniref:Ribosome biogenesis protein n=1 Tax=Meloidogyne hapla TaxID=6305 RepID=A0A1I8BHF0_MELHA
PLKLFSNNEQAANRALLELFKRQQQHAITDELIGVPESTQVLPSERYSSDVAAVTSLFNVMGVEPTPIIYRLGRKDNPSFNGRPRLIKAVFPSRQFQYQTLGAWKRHRDAIRLQPQFKNVLIRPSLTLAEREKEREQRALRRATMTGKTNFNSNLTTN